MSRNEFYSDLYDYQFKFIIIGESGVGKSSLMTQYTESRFEDSHEMTIGVGLGIRTLHLDGYPSTKVMVWDTAGMEVFRSIALSYFRNAIGAMFVYDITREETFNSIQKWMEDARKHCDDNCVFMVLGNKTDLEHLRQVDKLDLKRLSGSHGMPSMETSAKTVFNVEEAFTLLVKEVHDQIQNGVILYKPSHSDSPFPRQSKDPAAKCCKR